MRNPNDMNGLVRRHQQQDYHRHHGGAPDATIALHNAATLGSITFHLIYHWRAWSLCLKQSYEGERVGGEGSILIIISINFNVKFNGQWTVNVHKCWCRWKNVFRRNQIPSVMNLTVKTKTSKGYFINSHTVWAYFNKSKKWLGHLKERRAK